MIPLYNQEDFDNSNYATMFPLQCAHCSKTFHKAKKRILDAQRYNQQGKCIFCSNTCRGLAKSVAKNLLVECLNCKTIFSKHLGDCKKHPNHFCGHSCRATYHNTHKTKGYRRSKLELWLENQLTNLYPNLTLQFNNKDIINSELDIYIVELKLAIELNGIFHYEPIYGQDQLSKIQNNDTRKFQACIEHGIELCIIDTSKQKKFNPKSSQQYLDIITNIINSKATPPGTDPGPSP